MYRLRALSVAMVSGLVFAGTTQAGTWRPFVNDRFGTATDVPADWGPQPAPTNGDGREFRGRGGAVLRVYGSYSGTLLGTMAGYRRELADSLRGNGVAISLDTAGPNWFALSGVRGSRVVYYKVVLGCGATHHVNFEYGIEDKPRLDPIVAHVARQLHCLQPKDG